jgi:tripartite-type tricarboxylate transporter receptor subunit TctC
MIKTAAFLAGALVLTSSALSAQIYPSRPITLIVPFAVGGSNDIVGRTIGKKLADGGVSRWSSKTVPARAV